MSHVTSPLIKMLQYNNIHEIIRNISGDCGKAYFLQIYTAKLFLLIFAGSGR